FNASSPRGASLQVVADPDPVDEPADAEALPETAPTKDDTAATTPAAAASPSPPATAVASLQADAPEAAKATKSFEKPMYNGRRLSWCHDFDAGCGKPAADAFCKTNGFASAEQFTVDAHIGDVQPTRSIGSGAVCDQVPCDGFKVIQCSM